MTLSPLQRLRALSEPRGFVLLAALLPFYHLGFGEIQSWDEALYAVRAEACTRFGAFFDQSHYAVGGEYSSIHPPLVIWLIALFRSVFGHSVFVTRLPIALLGAVAVIMLFVFLRRYVKEDSAVLGSVLLGVSQAFLLYSHRAQLEVPLLAGVIATLYFFSKASEERGWSHGLWFAVCLGLVLWMKFAIGLFVLPFLIARIWQTNAATRRRLILWTIAGLLIGSPWYAHVMMTHSSHLASSFLDIQQGTYVRSTGRAWWYYLNQLIVNAPLLIPALLILWKSKAQAVIHGGLIKASAIWLISAILVLTLVSTRMLHFSVIMLPAACILAAVGFDRYSQLEWSKGGRRRFIALCGVLVVWSSSEQLRLLVKGELHTSFIMPSMILLGITIGMFAAYFKDRREGRIWSLSTVLTSVLLIIAVVRLEDQSEAVFSPGARVVADTLKKDSAVRTLTIVHPDVEHESYAPQLAYYLDGWTLGWQKDKSAETQTWQQALATTSVKSDATIVEHMRDRFTPQPPGEAALLAGLDSAYSSRYARRLVTSGYTLYY